ncbi:MAG TPA: cytidylate kinase-like family protein [Candidatus Baltobacteraceae bacterium]|nr:cytidylate kinase-like family protein [Candidatus Baltobacteraceae bacterium]
MILTISNQYGSGAVAIAQRVAAELGYEFVDRQLPVVVAKRMHISDAQAQAADETGRSLGARLLSSLELATPEVAVTSFGETFDEEYVREVQEAVREFAAHGNVVIVGRGAGAILGRRPDVLRVFIYAPRDWRIERVIAELGFDRKAAAAEIDRIDRARRAHLRDWYNVEIGSPAVVDLAIDSATVGLEGSAAVIIAAVQAR